MNGFRLLYDGDCGLCERAASVVARRLPDWEIVAAHGLDEVRVERPDGPVLGGADAVNAVLAALLPAAGPLLAALVRVPPLFACERAAYRFVAAHRARISRLIGARACGAAADRGGRTGPGLE